MGTHRAIHNIVLFVCKHASNESLQPEGFLRAVELRQAELLSQHLVLWHSFLSRQQCHREVVYFPVQST